VKDRWTIVALVSAALLVGTALGPAVVDAATASLVRVEGGGSMHVAKVNAAGQLSVTDSTHHTKAGQLQVATAAPGQSVTLFFGPTCKAGGDYTVPRGKALIITGLTFLNLAANPARPSAQVVQIGPAASPCKTTVAVAASSSEEESLSQTFDPGIAVPAGDAVGGQGVNGQGAVALYGYLVPAADVPASAVSSHTHTTPYRLGILRH
jgi:hypothetical protein